MSRAETSISASPPSNGELTPMLLLVDVFEYLSVVVHALVLTAQSATVGGSLFLRVPGAPIRGPADDAGRRLRRRPGVRWCGNGAPGRADHGLERAGAGGGGGAHHRDAGGGGRAKKSGFGLGDIIGREFRGRRAGQDGGGLAVGLTLFAARPRPPLLGLCGVMLGAAVMTTHSYARLDDRGLLMTATALHLFGAAVWIGGIAVFRHGAVARCATAPACAWSGRGSRA